MVLASGADAYGYIATKKVSGKLFGQHGQNDTDNVIGCVYSSEFAGPIVLRRVQRWEYSRS